MLEYDNQTPIQKKLQKTPKNPHKPKPKKNPNHHTHRKL